MEDNITYPCFKKADLGRRESGHVVSDKLSSAVGEILKAAMPSDSSPSVTLVSGSPGAGKPHSEDICSPGQPWEGRGGEKGW